ncbi:hypothetical protein [uncultured Prevotella sp.]|uniref:hypothetical protein n=1 Tax=uncultured Prevotella sp. TaxID=159272 RepID=UPI00260D1B8C|nr:hypothetical protein [uncultured Prevotella sp.]
MSTHTKALTYSHLSHFESKSRSVKIYYSATLGAKVIGLRLKSSALATQNKPFHAQKHHPYTAFSRIKVNIR